MNRTCSICGDVPLPDSDLCVACQEAWDKCFPDGDPPKDDTVEKWEERDKASNVSSNGPVSAAGEQEDPSGQPP